MTKAVRPYVYRGGTVIDAESAVPIYAEGPEGRLLHGLLDRLNSVYQTVGQGWNDLHWQTRQVTIPVAAWNEIWDSAGRIEFVDHADNRVLVLDIDVARGNGVVVPGPVGELVAVPLHCCTMWTPPVDAVADQPIIGALTKHPGYPSPIVDAVLSVPARPQPNQRFQILLDAGPSERGWHHAQTMLRCPQLYAYKYLLQCIEATKAEPLIKGSLGHIGLAHHYARLQATQLGDDPERFYSPEAAIRLLAARYGSHWQAWQDLAIETVNAYISYYRIEWLRIIAVEEQMRMEIAGHTFTQRADLIVQQRDGLVLIVDHKTAGYVGKDPMERYRLSGQFLGMQHFGPMLYPENFGGVRGNFLGLRAESNPNYRFKRKPPHPAPHAMACFPQAIIDAEEDIRRGLESGRDPWYWPKRLNESICQTLYGPCPGTQWCTWGPEASAQ